MIGKKINQLATELAPASTDLTIIGNPTTGVSKKITLAQLGAIFSGAVSFYTNLASFPATGTLDVIFCAKDTQKLYLWSGSAYVEVFPSQALLDTYQLRSEKGVSNGYASLDSSGKVPISQLPSSIMEYKGTWNAATNTPTLANGTGDTGDVYICNVAGTVNFGAGPITFAVGDYVIYSGSIWQRSSGAVGTVTSVGLSITGDSIGVSNSPITTSGTLALAFAGTSSQYINGAGNLTTFPSLTGYVPYTGATANVDLGTFDLTADILTAATGSYTSSGGGNTLEISHTSGSGIALNITKGGNGEGLYINKTSGTGNAATIVGTLEATTLVKTGGTSSQFLKADGSVDSSTYLTTSAAATTYLPMVLSSTANSIEINGQFFDVASAANSYTSGRLIIAPTYGAIGYQNAGVFDGLKILTNGNAEFSNSGITRFFNQVRFDSTLTNGTYTYTLPSATGTLALTSDLTGGTVTSVGLSSATSGVTIGSTPITTSGTITLAIATASGSQQGLLSSTDWTTFNNKQSALTNPVTGTGTTNYLPKFTGTSTIGNSQIFDNGTNVGIGMASPNAKLEVTSGTPVSAEIQRWSYNNGNADFSLRLRQDVSSGLVKHVFDVVNNGVTYSNNLVLTNGNLGLGVSPSAWATSKALQIGATSVLWNYNSAENFYIGSNYYFDGSRKYIVNGYATEYAQYSGSHNWFTAPSGTAGNAISFTQAMTLNASGNLSIGNTNDTYKLDVSGTGRFTSNLYTSTALYINTTAAYGFRINSEGDNGFYNRGGSTASHYPFLLENSSGSLLFQIQGNGVATFGSSGGSGLRVYGGSGTNQWDVYLNSTNLRFSDNTGTGSVVFDRPISGTSATFSSSVTAGGNIQTTGGSFFAPNNGRLGFGSGTTYLDGDANNAVIRFITNNSEAMRIASGNVGIGTTSPSSLLHVNSGTTATQTVANFAAANYGSSSSRTYIQIGTQYGDGSSRIGSVNTTGNQSALIFQTQSATSGVWNDAMYINGSANVGIGTTSPAYKLDVSSDVNSENVIRSINLNSGAAATARIYVENNIGSLGQLTTYSSGFGFTVFGSYAGNYTALLSSGASSAGLLIGALTSDPVIFGTDNTERMRITSGGEILAGSTSAGLGFVSASKFGSYQPYTTDSNSTAISSQRTAGMFAVSGGDNSNNQGSYTSIVANVQYGASNNPGAIFRGYGNTTLAVQINYNGNITNTNNSYGAISDISLKENISDTTSKLADLLKVKVRNYNLIGDDKKQIGVIAQELETIFPSMIETNSEGLKSVKYSVFVPMLIKAIQELNDKIK